MSDRPTILITGGLGAIGSNLANKLCLDNEVVIIDNLTSGVISNISDMQAVSLYKNDLRDSEILKRVFDKHQPQIVYHLAANFANQNSVDNPLLDAEVNCIATLQLLKIAKEYEVSRFIYASSSGVYGSTISDMHEELTGNLETPYYIHKKLGEDYCSYFHSHFNLNTSSIRIFNSYGPGELSGQYRNVIPNFIDLAVRKQPLPVMGTGLETRDFTYVSDIVDGFVTVQNCSHSAGEVYNLGNGYETTVLELAETINIVTNNNGGINFIPKRDWDGIDRRCANITKIKERLDWSPTVSLTEGIERYYRWYLEKLRS